MDSNRRRDDSQARQNADRMLRDLREQLNAMSRRLAEVETQYQDLGLLYYSIAPEARDELIQDNALHDAFTSSEGDFSLTIMELNSLRRTRQEVREAIRRGDIQQAQTNINQVNRDIDQLAAALNQTQDSLVRIAVQAQQQSDRYGPGGIPQLAEGTTLGPEEIARFGDQYQALRDWALTLPEVSDLVEQGRVTADQAFLGAIRLDEERRIPTPGNG